MAIPAILKGDTSGSIVLDIKAGYEYEGCTLAVVFNGVRKEFTGLVAGGTKSLQYTADETAGMPLGTAHATMTLTNAAGVVRSMPWVRIRVTDIPAEIYDRHIDVDPSQLDVEPAKAGDSLGEVKAKLNAVMAFLRGGAACLLACVGLASFGDIGPTTPLNDVPGDTTISNLVVKSGVSTGGGGGGITAQDATNAATAVVARDVPGIVFDTVSGDARVLPPYLHAVSFDDTYPDDAAWYYAQAVYAGGCSARRVGGILERCYDWTFDDAPVFLTRITAAADRFGSIGMAGVGTNITERMACSGKWSRYYKCLPGHTLDGINENGVVAEINVVGGDPQTSGWHDTGDLHPLAAVRWALDHGTNAQQAAQHLAACIRFPAGWSQNFHYMIADASATYIVEDGVAHEVTGTAAMTNYALYSGGGGAGTERYALLTGGASITNVWFTNAYGPTANWASEFESTAQMEAATNRWATAPKEAHRGERYGALAWWQTVHCSVYDIASRTVRVAVQERDDWYTFALPPAAPVQSVNGKTGAVQLAAADVGAVATNAYWSVKKGGEGGIGVKLGTAGIYSTFYVGYNDFGEIQNGAHWQYANGGYEDFFSGSVLRMLTGSKPWLQTATDFRIGGNSYGGGTQLPAWVDGRITGAVPAWARAADKPSYTAAEVGARPSSWMPTAAQVGARPSSWTPTAAEVGAYPAADGQQLAGLVNTWEGYWGGTNVIFEVTNYYGNTSGEIPRLRIKELVHPDNEAPYWRIVWDDNDKFTVQYTNILAQVAKTNAACKAELEQWTHEQLAGKAPVAWGSVTDKGTTNVQPNSVWMTSPNTYFAGGTEYQRVAVGAGAICVLTCNGATAYTAGQEGTFRFQDEGGTNYFGFAKTESYTIPCRTDDIKVEQQIVTLRYDVIMGGSEVPVIYYTPTLQPCAWVQLNNPGGTECPGAPYSVTWYTEGGSYYAALNVGTAPQGFFRAETSVAGDVVFETNMKLRIDGGVLCTDGVTVIYPHANGTWSTTK